MLQFPEKGRGTQEQFEQVFQGVVWVRLSQVNEHTNDGRAASLKSSARSSVDLPFRVTSSNSTHLHFEVELTEGCNSRQRQVLRSSNTILIILVVLVFSHRTIKLT
jgi:hypothetical protein